MAKRVRDLHRDLARKYQRHGPRIIQMWTSLSQVQREKSVRACSVEDGVLPHSQDTRLGDIYKFVPEWNIQDLTAPSPDHFLDMLKYRATNTLTNQYMFGVNDGPGDYAIIVEMMQKNNIQPRGTFRDCYTLFITNSGYGQLIKLVVTEMEMRNKVLAQLAPGINSHLIVTQEIGELILVRQGYLLQLLNMVIDDILEAESTTRSQTRFPKQLYGVDLAALSNLSIHEPSQKLKISDLVNISMDQISFLDDYINLLSTEPIVLAEEVNFWFFTRPEFVADEKGGIILPHTERYISEALFEAVLSSVKTAALWNYMHRLLLLLKSSTDKQFRAMIVKELSATSQLEYARAQSVFKRSVSENSDGSKWFKRMTTVQKDGIIRIAMKGDPEILTADNPQLHYMLRLCQDRTNWSSAAEWLQKLEDLHRAHPLEKQKMSSREFGALGALALIVIFIQSLSSVAQLPAVGQKKGNTFLSGYASLESEVRKLKPAIDIHDYVTPIEEFLEPGMSSCALSALGDFLVKPTSTKLGFLYQDLVDDNIASLSKRHVELKAKASQAEQYVTPMESEEPTIRVEARRQKEKTRPVHAPIFDIIGEVTNENPQNNQITPTQPPLTVKASTAAIFSSLLSRSSEARGSISWDAFSAAMADVGFSIMPKVGSIYTLVPPEHLVVHAKLTLHRPHESHIEGPGILIYSRRLKRVYGWDESTFVSS
ncbi:hypothetical protein IQ07DRAFT_642510 [Pyrenochaeta sp. DS3sAY3a]|nr:hypothetical protein IQ07DRAFT_642510 [Pyrenochaeta sp. DS3sAY3a]